MMTIYFVFLLNSPSDAFYFLDSDFLREQKTPRREKKALRYKRFTFFATALNIGVKHRRTGCWVNALLAYDKIQGTKGNWKESERGRMMKYEIFVSRDAAIYPSVQRR